ncbi:hypothetical protein ACFPRL_15300 [Pseudoclavibacter helvolus]
MAAYASSLESAEISSVTEFQDNTPRPLPSRLAVIRGQVGTAVPGSGAPRVRRLAISTPPREPRGKEADRLCRRRQAPRNGDGSPSTARSCR